MKCQRAEAAYLGNLWQSFLQIVFAEILQTGGQGSPDRVEWLFLANGKNCDGVVVSTRQFSSAPNSLLQTR